MKILVILTAILALFVTVPVSAQQLPFGHYSIDDGLVDSVVMKIYQDSKGFLWFGTRAGLNRFDGLEFHTFTEDDGLCHNVIRDLYEADDGSLYVMKFVGAGQGPKALIAELVAGEIARVLGLSVPEIVFINLDPVMGRSEPDAEIQELPLSYPDTSGRNSVESVGKDRMPRRGELEGGGSPTS